jgi:hypothetical protein
MRELTFGEILPLIPDADAQELETWLATLPLATMLRLMGQSHSTV